MNFVALDFETANYSKNSACSIGIVKVSGGKISLAKHWYIKPPTMTFIPKFIDIHGITPETVMNAPTFGQIWPDIKDILASTTLVAHNASFDMAVLSSLLEHYDIGTTNLPYLCSLQISRKIWRHYENHKLSTISARLGIELNHHEALSDAKACAQIVLAAGMQEHCQSLPALCHKLSLTANSIAARNKRNYVAGELSSSHAQTAASLKY